jgi:hypothetical protein
MGHTGPGRQWAAAALALSHGAEPEDVFALSRGVDWILNYPGDLVSESRVMDCPPTP